MKAIINNLEYELTGFTIRESPIKVLYLLSMDINEVGKYAGSIDDIRTAKEFIIIDGTSKEFYDNVSFDYYGVNSENIITFCFYKERGERISVLTDQVEKLNINLENLSEVVDFLSLYGNELNKLEEGDDLDE